MSNNTVIALDSVPPRYSQLQDSIEFVSGYPKADLIYFQIAQLWLFMTGQLERFAQAFRQSNTDYAQGLQAEQGKTQPVQRENTPKYMSHCACHSRPLQH